MKKNVDIRYSCDFTGDKPVVLAFLLDEHGEICAIWDLKKERKLLKHWKYFCYVVRHKWFVFLACCKMGIPFHGLRHDWSKFLPDEWFAYANYFYGEAPKYAEAFNRAWLKHQRRNKHHWQWWVLRRDSGESIPVEMPKNLILEMLADWVGAQRSIKGSVDIAKWYDGHKRIMILGETTRTKLEHYIEQEIWR